MMKTWRKSLAILCALALIFSMVPTAFANFDDGNNAQGGEPTEIVQGVPKGSAVPSEEANSEDDEDGLPILMQNSLLYSEEEPTTPITIFYTSDLHGAFTGKNFATGGTHAGMARIATLLKAEREKVAPGSYITIDLGDSIQGAGSSGFIGNGDYTFPLIKAFNYLEYDAVILGNHEFNFGIDNMYLAYNGNGVNSTGFNGDKLTGNAFYHTGTPPIEANGEIDGTDDLLDEFVPYAIYTANGVDVAVIGMTHPGSDVWDAVKLETAQIYTESATTATIRAINEIKGDLADPDDDLADIIVLAVHTSQSNSFDRDGSGAASILADQFVAENVDVFLGAHGHSRTDNRVINGVRYIENSSNGGSMGIVTLNATQDEDGTWYVADKVNDVSTIARQISTSSSNANYVEEDADYLTHMADEIAFAEAYTAGAIGELIGGDMVPAREIAGSNPAYLQPTKLVSFINEVQSYYAEAQISGACAFNNSVQHLEGEITRGSLIGIYNYDSNTVYRLEMRGWQVKEWMEWAVGGSSQYSTYNPETDLTIRHNTSYRSDQFSGVEYTVDLSKAVGERITITAFTGDGGSVPFNDDTIYTVAANDYRTSSGILPLFTDEQIAAAGGYPRIDAVDTNRGLSIAPDIISLMADYIENVMDGEIDATDYEANWSFVTSWDADLRAKALELIADGTISYSTSRAVTVAQVREATAATLSVLSTTDMHGRIWDVNPLDNSAVYNSMLSAATIIANKRADSDFSLVIDNGDLIQGTAMTSYNVNAEAGVENPMAIALRYIGYDAFVPGNHEFNYTLPIQEKFYDILLEDSGVYPNNPVTPIAANILSKADDSVADPFEPYIIREYVVGGKTFKVGVLGFENVNVPNWDPEAHYEGMKFSSTQNTEQSFVWEWENRWRDILVEDEGCDIIIISMHTGNGSSNFNKENQGRYFIENSSGFDLVIGGHDHSARVAEYFDKNGKSVYFVNGGGGNVTETSIKLYIDGTYSVAPSTNTSLGSRNSVVTPDAGLVTLMEPYYDKAVTFVQAPIGTLAGDWDRIGNFFVNQADGQNLVHEAQLWAAYPVGGADVSISGPVNRSSWHPGQLFVGDESTADIALKDLYNLYRYDNNLYYVIEMTGAQLKSWMEETAKFYSVNGSGNATGSGFGLDTFYGVNYEVYVGNPVGSRVQNVTYKGQPLSDTEILKVAMCSYRLSATADNDEFGWYKATGLTASGDHVLYVGAEAPEFGAVGGSVTLVIGEYIKAMTALGNEITPPDAISSWAVYPTTYTAPPTGGSSNNGSGKPSTSPNTSDETFPTITTPAGQPAVKNENGTTTLPGGGTVEMPDGVVVDAPAGTVVDENGTVTIPNGAEAQISLPDEAAIITVSGGSTINIDGSVTVGNGGATVTTASGYIFTLTENSVIIPDADVPLGFVVSSGMNFADVALSVWYSGAVNYVYTLGLMNGTGESQFSPDMEMSRAMLVTVLWRMSGMPSASGASNYTDVTAGSWYEAAVAWAAGNNIVTGYSELSFGPNDSITREQLALILYRYCEFMGFDVSYEAGLSDFADADGISDWASVAMAWAYSNGLITGRSATELAPGDTATRAEVATVLQRFLEL